MLKSLLPFVVTVGTFFYFQQFLRPPSLLMLILKCLPIYSLSAAVYLYGKFKKSKYNIYIFYGLLWSSIGDACLVWKDYFPPGMAAFAIAHCFYIRAFSFKPLKPYIGGFMYILLGVMLMIMLPNIQDKLIFYGMPIYGLFLATMSWRAVAKMTDPPNALSWPKISCAVGSILFVISDIIICFHDLQEPIPFGQVFIMTTYYAAQLGISWSITGEFESDDKKR